MKEDTERDFPRRCLISGVCINEKCLKACLRQRETGVKRAGHTCAKRKAESDGGEGRGADINE